MAASNPNPVVAIVYAGGTIGMSGDPLKSMKRPQFMEILGAMPGFQYSSSGLLTVTLPIAGPPSPKQRKIDIEFVGSLEPKDSADAEPTDWADIAGDVMLAITDGRYAGIVVLHGTDTLAWTASALSFFLPSVKKPVVLTGSQAPLANTRSDALRNFVTAIEIAADTKCPKEVLIFFDQLLLRGNRSTKTRLSGFDGFDSPNFPRLGTAGTSLTYTPTPDGHWSGPSTLPVNLQNWREKVKDVVVISLRVFPGLNVFPHLISSWTRLAIIVEAYGSGTASRYSGLRDFLTKAKKVHGAVIVLRTQVPNGAVEVDRYEASDWLEGLVIHGSDITGEACVSKLYYLLASEMTPEEIGRAMTSSIRGEVSLPPLKPQALPESSEDSRQVGMAREPVWSRSILRTEEAYLEERLYDILRRSLVMHEIHLERHHDGGVDIVIQYNGLRVGIECTTRPFGAGKAHRVHSYTKISHFHAFVVVGVAFSEAARRIINQAGGVTMSWDEALRLDWRKKIPELLERGRTKSP